MLHPLAPPTITSLLHHHEVLHPSQLRHNVITRRDSIHSVSVTARQIHFYCLGRWVELGANNSFPVSEMQGIKMFTCVCVCV